MKLFFDTETTGLPLKGQYDNPKHPQCPRMVELGALLFDNSGKLLEKLEAIVKPNGFSIPEAAANVHKITTERAIVEGREQANVLCEFDILLDQCDTLIAHNLQYDWLVIRREYLEHTDVVPEHLIRPTQFCTKDATTNICKIPSGYGKFKWPTLMEAHKHFFHEEFSGAHGALADVMACARIYFKLQNIDIDANAL